MTKVLNGAKATGHPGGGKKKESYLKTYTKNKFQMNCRSKWVERINKAFKENTENIFIILE